MALARATLCCWPPDSAPADGPIFVDFYRLQDFIHTLLHVLLWHLADFQAIFHVLADRQMGEDGIALEHHADVPFLGRNIVDDLVVKFDGSPSMLLNPAIMRSRVVLPGTGGPQQGKEFPIFIKADKSGMMVVSPYFFTTLSIPIETLIRFPSIPLK